MRIEFNIRTKVGKLLKWEVKGKVPLSKIDLEESGETSAELVNKIWNIEQAINQTDVRAHISIEAE